jgi:hypothetical protein
MSFAWLTLRACTGLVAIVACGTDDGAPGHDTENQSGSTDTSSAQTAGTSEASTSSSAPGTDSGGSATDACAIDPTSCDTGSTSSATVDGGSDESSGDSAFSTDFPAEENPISQGGIWQNGGMTGLQWHDVQTTSGKAFGAAMVGGYDDCIAHLDPDFRVFGPDQFAEATVFRVDGYAPGVSHEIELLLRFSVTPNDAHGYEVLWGVNGNLAIVRWNGPLNDYTPLLDNVEVGGPAVDGDVLRAEIIDDVISVYRNDALVATGPADSTWPSGQPGLGFWPTTGATPANYGWKHYTASEL